MHKLANVIEEIALHQNAARWPGLFGGIRLELGITLVVDGALFGDAF